MAFDDDSGTGLRSLVTFPVQAGTAYRIKVDGFGATNGLLNLHIQNGPPPTCQGVPATIVGTINNDVINGTAGNDVIVAGNGNDTSTAWLATTGSAAMPATTSSTPVPARTRPSAVPVRTLSAGKPTTTPARQRRLR